MVGLAETAATKTMVRSHNGINGAFVVETTGGGKSGLAVQLEGSNFETVWQLKEGGEGGILNLDKVSFAHVSMKMLSLPLVLVVKCRIRLLFFTTVVFPPKFSLPPSTFLFQFFALYLHS